ncbi:MAG: VOC family protein [Pseudomonadota bacterium]
MSVPDGYNSLATYLISPEAEQIVSLAIAAFDASPVNDPIRLPDGRMMHVTLRIGDSTVMVGQPPDGAPGMTAMIHLYVDDCDTAHARAVAAGGVEEMAPADQVHGDRASMVRDAGGNRWWIATRIETVRPDEIARRAAAQHR